MSNEDAWRIELPSLPKGGGAISSIGDGVGAVKANGAATCELPLPISPGRGFAPTLALVYNSSAGNGMFGMGWNHTLSVITRRTSIGVPAYTDEDEFLGPDGGLLMAE
ncbi:SpvB/TcaC N-terminal domain-containing protein, partial [Priestia sp. SIMBA_032]|uniref:SpvB/TcaC N-terminal domain-containing protein n=1 Tax=Priestia sp. SIMBA_032 TaxID=3085775 RepID=UPI00397D588E